MTSRRSFLLGAVSGLIAAPAIVRVSSIMQIKVVEAPLAWVPCDGRLLSKRKYQDLFGVIGHTYGGQDDLFAVPNMRRYAVSPRDQSGELRFQPHPVQHLISARPTDPMGVGAVMQRLGVKA